MSKWLKTTKKNHHQQRRHQQKEGRKKKSTSMLQRKMEDLLPAHLVSCWRDCAHHQDCVSPLAHSLPAVELRRSGVFICLYERGSSIYRVNGTGKLKKTANTYTYTHLHTHTHTQKRKKTTPMLSRSPSRTVKWTWSYVEDDCGGYGGLRGVMVVGGTRGRLCQIVTTRGRAARWASSESYFLHITCPWRCSRSPVVAVLIFFFFLSSLLTHNSCSRFSTSWKKWDVRWGEVLVFFFFGFFCHSLLLLLLSPALSALEIPVSFVSKSPDFVQNP